MLNILIALGSMAFGAGATDISGAIAENMQQERVIRQNLQKNWKSNKEGYSIDLKPDFKSTAEEVLGRPEPETINVRETRKKRRYQQQRRGALQVERNNLDRVSGEFGN